MKKFMEMLQVLLCLALIPQLAGCGTLMYPERRGQKGGRIDVGVAVLDGIGLFFFLIPGIIAFAVDFSEGTIYLPPGTLASSLDRRNMRVAKFDPKHATVATIEEIIQKETGQNIKFDQENIEVARLKSLEDINRRFAKVLPMKKNIRIALNTR